MQKEVEQLEAITTPEDEENYMYDSVLELQHKKVYRKKIKGFHLAFSIKDKLAETSKYKY